MSKPKKQYVSIEAVDESVKEVSKLIAMIKNYLIEDIKGEEINTIVSLISIAFGSVEEAYKQMLQNEIEHDDDPVKSYEEKKLVTKPLKKLH